MTTDSPQQWNAILRRLLDVLAANAQPYVKDQEIYYRWGQHIYDDVGDNTGQFGIHGTSEATRAIAVGVTKLGHNTRYEKFLVGGVRCLIDWIDKPKKPLDFNKTVKVGEWLGTLTEGGVDKIHVDRLVVALLAGRDSNSAAWDWDPTTRVESPVLMPTLYALDGLTRVYSKYGQYNEEIKLAIQYSLDTLREDTPAHTDAEARLSWETALFKLCEVIDLYENVQNTASTFRTQVEQLLRMIAGKRTGILVSKRFEYRIVVQGQEEHAFCVLPTGLMRLQAQLWGLALELKFDLDIDLLKNELFEFIESIYSSKAFPLGNVGSCSHAARLIARFGPEIDLLVEEVQHTGRRGAASAIRTTQAPAKPPDPYENRPLRQGLYEEILKPEGVKKVKILQEFFEGYSGAHLDLCQITEANDTPRILQVLKLDKLENTKQEAEAAKLAQEIIPTKYRVDLFQDYTVDEEKGLLRYRYAGEAGLLPSVEQFLKFVTTADETTLITDAISKIYRKALAQAVSNVDSDNATLNEIRQSFEMKRHNKFWLEVLDGYRSLQEKQVVQRGNDQPDYVILNFPFETLENPLAVSERTREAWERPFAIDRAGYGHGDLNPRNILMVADDESDAPTPILIDFNRFSRNVFLPIDYARLEAGIQIKALRDYFEKAAIDPSQKTYLVRYEDAVNASHDFLLEAVTKKISTAGVPQELTRARKCIATIRKCYFERVSPSAKNDLRGYFAVLMLNYFSYLRPVYFEALTDRQRQFAFYCAAGIFNRHFLYPAK